MNLLGFVFGDRWFLLLALPLAALVAWRLRRRPPTVDGGSVQLGADLPRTWRTRAAWLPGALGTLAALLLIVALARPLKGREESRIYTEGLDIVLVVDTSSSMLEDTLRQGVPNIEMVKAVVAEFVKARGNDRMGLVTFAAWPRTECPLTLDHDTLQERLKAVHCVERNTEEDGTAIGVALGQAARKLKDSDAKSKVVILLTDGQNNQFAVDPLQAAALCKDFGVKVHTIYAEPVVRQGGRQLPVPSVADELLRRIAVTTGGSFFRATEARALQEVYAKIDALERTAREDVRYTDYEDLYPWLLVPAGALLVLELLLRRGPLLEFAS
jgi:Ca-activated chloride channel family protein